MKRGRTHTGAGRSTAIAGVLSAACFGWLWLGTVDVQAKSMEDTSRAGMADTAVAEVAEVSNAPQGAATDPDASRDPIQARRAGARWLAQHQSEDGGWGSGNWNRGQQATRSDVATTAIATMALMRVDPPLATFRGAVERGVSFVVSAIERSPAQGPLLEGPEGTQPQHKLGRNVDTHFASLLLGEVMARVPGKLDAGLEKRVGVAYDKVLTKVVAAQGADGSFEEQGWAPVLSSSVAAQGLYKALENGRELPEAVLDKADAYQNELVDPETGSFDASRGAGVTLYSAASGLRGNAQAEKRAGDADGKAARAKQVATGAVRRDRGELLRGFGSIGGEEMLSYMMISDTLAEEGGDDWTDWQRRIGRHLSVSQNADGSWSGHHCITSTPFVTAAAVMALGAGPA